MNRTLDADVDSSGHLLAVEAIVLGRTAMGEAARSVSVTDRWRIRRGGKLVFADGLRLDGDAAATLAGARNRRRGARNGDAGAGRARGRRTP